MKHISKNVPQFKANLHSHSTLSDGCLSPEELVKAYRERNYSVLAITDHEYPCDHTALSTADFLLLTGYEAYLRPSKTNKFDPLTPEIHLNLLAKEPHNLSFVCYDPNFCKYIPPELAEKLPHVGPVGKHRYSKRFINRFIAEARKAGYLVTYNHPCWSMENPADILDYDGFFSLEIYNTGSLRINNGEQNLALFDMLLRHGKFPYVHGADDNHNQVPFDDLLNDSFGAWTVICAKELSYPAIIRALEQGNFYASTGPSICALEIDGKHARLQCSPARRVMMQISPKAAFNVYNSDGSPVTEAVFELPAFAPYVYFAVIAEDGGEARTHAFPNPVYKKTDRRGFKTGLKEAN